MIRGGFIPSPNEGIASTKLAPRKPNPHAPRPALRTLKELANEFGTTPIGLSNMLRTDPNAPEPAPDFIRTRTPSDVSRGDKGSVLYPYRAMQTWWAQYQATKTSKTSKT